MVEKETALTTTRDEFDTSFMDPLASYVGSEGLEQVKKWYSEKLEREIEKRQHRPDIVARRALLALRYVTYTRLMSKIREAALENSRQRVKKRSDKKQNEVKRLLHQTDRALAIIQEEPAIIQTIQQEIRDIDVWTVTHLAPALRATGVKTGSVSLLAFEKTVQVGTVISGKLGYAAGWTTVTLLHVGYEAVKQSVQKSAGAIQRAVQRYRSFDKH